MTTISNKNIKTLPASLKLKAKYLKDSTSVSFHHNSIVNHLAKKSYITLRMSEVQEEINQRILLNSIENILYHEGQDPVRVLIEGKTGIGKSTTLSAILELWSKEHFQEFKYLFKINLEILQNDGWKSDYSDKIRDYPLACLIHASLDQTSRDNRISLDEIIEILNLPDQNETILLVDGYDKIEPLLCQRFIKRIIDQIFSDFTHIVVTARPETMIPLYKNYFHRLIEIEGLDLEGIYHFTNGYFIAQKEFLINKVLEFYDHQLYPEKNIKNLLNYLRKSTKIDSLEAYYRLKKILQHEDNLENKELIVEKINSYLDTTINKINDLARKNNDIQTLLSNPGLAILFFIKVANSINTSSEIKSNLSLDDLYSGIIEQIAEKFYNEDEIENPLKRVKEFKALKDLSLIALENGFLTRQDILDISEKYNTDEDKLLSLGIIRVKSLKKEPKSLKPINFSFREIPRESYNHEPKNFIFNDKSILDYFAAHSIVEKLSLERNSPEARKAAELIALHRYDRSYLTLIKFISGILIKNEDHTNLSIIRFIEAIRSNLHETVETGISNSIKLWMNVLAQMSINGRPDPRIPDVEEMVKFIDKILCENLIQYKSDIISSGYVSSNLINFIEETILKATTPSETDNSFYPKTKTLTRSNAFKIQRSEIDEEKSDDSDIISHQDIVYSSFETSKIHSNDFFDDKKSSTEDEKRIILVKAAIDIYSSLTNNIDQNHIYLNLEKILVLNQNEKILKAAINAIIRMISNKKISQENTRDFLETLKQFEHLFSLADTIEIARKTAISDEISSNSADMSFSTYDYTLQDSANLSSDSPVKEKIEPNNLDNNNYYSGKDLSRLVLALIRGNYDQKLIDEIIKNLSIQSTLINESWIEKMRCILVILNHLNNDNISVDSGKTRKLIKSVYKAGQEYIKFINDTTHYEWIINNFEKLKRSTGELFKPLMQSLTFQALSDNSMSQQECELICKYIELGIDSSITVKPAVMIAGVIQYTILYNGRNYELIGEQNAIHIERIIQTAIDYHTRVELPNFKNTGSGIRIAATEIDCSSMVDENIKVKTDKPVLAIVYETRHKFNDFAEEVKDIYLLIEERDPYFGNYKATKIYVDEAGGLLRIFFTSHPLERDTAYRTQIFGAMQYIDNMKTRIISLVINDFKKDIFENELSGLTKPKERSSLAKLQNSLAVGSLTSKQSTITLEDKIKIIYQLISKFQKGLSINPLEDINSPSQNNFIIHNREIIDALDPNHAASFRIEIDTNKNTFAQFKKTLNLEILKRLLAKEELKASAQEEMNLIANDPYKYSMYKTIVLLTNSFFVAMSAISTGRVKDEGKGAIGVIGSLFNEVGSDFPIFGRAVKIVGTLFTAVDNVLAQKKIQNFKNFALSSVEMAKISDKIARKLVKSELHNLKKSIPANILSLIDSAVNIANAGIAQTIVEACNAFKEDLESRVRISHLSSEEREIESLEEQGKNDGEILAQAVLDAIFNGRYTSTRTERGLIEYTKAAVSIAYSREESLANSVAKEVILHFNGKIDAENKSAEDSSSSESQTASTQLEQIGNNNQNTAGSEPKDKQVEHQRDLSAGGCRRSSCIILSALVSNNNPEIENLFAQIYNEHSYIKQPSTDTIAPPINYFINNEIGRKLLSLAEIYYGDKASKDMENLGIDRDLAIEIIELTQKEGFEYVLEVFFGMTDQKALETFENLISSEDRSGYFQYIYNALANNYYTNSAKNLIKTIASLQEKLENILNFGLEGDIISILIEQINILMEFAGSGERLISFRPPFRDPFGDGDNGDHGPSGGSSGQYFENNNHNQTNENSPEFIIIPMLGLNSTIYEI